VYGMNLGLDSSTIEPAVQYVQKIKQRCDDATYKRFLEILSKYHNTIDAVDEVSLLLSYAVQMILIMYTS
jgi:paired amphipathic helix protein Sin3a